MPQQHATAPLVVMDHDGLGHRVHHSDTHATWCPGDADGVGRLSPLPVIDHLDAQRVGLGPHGQFDTSGFTGSIGVLYRVLHSLIDRQDNIGDFVVGQTQWLEPADEFTPDRYQFGGLRRPAAVDKFHALGSHMTRVPRCAERETQLLRLSTAEAAEQLVAIFSVCPLVRRVLPAHDHADPSLDEVGFRALGRRTR